MVRGLGRATLWKARFADLRRLANFVRLPSSGSCECYECKRLLVEALTRKLEYIPAGYSR